MRENSLSHMNKANNFDINFADNNQKSNSRISKHHSSHERSANRSIQDVKVDDYHTNQNIIRKKPGHKSIKTMKMEKAHSFAKPILPPLNIDKIREENQNLEMNGMKTDKEMLYNLKSNASNYGYSHNLSDIEQKNVLALQGFQDVNMSEVNKSPIVKPGVNRIQAIPGIDTSDDENHKSDVENAEKTEAEIRLKGIAKIRMLARKMVDQDTVKEIPELTEMLEQEHIPHSHNETPDDSFDRKPSNSHLETSKITCLCELAPNSNLHKNTAPAEPSKDDFTVSKMRICLLNLLLSYIYKYEESMNVGIKSKDIDDITTLKSILSAQGLSNILY